MQFNLGNFALVCVAALAFWAVIPQIGPELADLPVNTYSCDEKTTAPVDVIDSLSELCALSLREKDPVPKYRREEFGRGWRDLDGDGCDTRAQILRRDLTHVKISPKNMCRVSAGEHIDPYTGSDHRYSRFIGSAVQIDHVVALHDAWNSGAYAWTPRQRQRFANDPRVLLAVSAKANQQKGDSNAAEWLPENRNYHCAYARQQILIKYSWNLSVTATEKTALLRSLGRC